MTIIIQTKSTSIPVEIGKLKFELDLSDDKLNDLVTKHDAIAKKIEEVKTKDLVAAKLVLKECFEFLLVEGSFEQIYEQTPSVIQCLDILFALVNATNEEIKQLRSNEFKEITSEYLSEV